MADQGRPKQTKSGGYRGGEGEFRGMPQQQIAAKQAAAKTDYGRPRQTMADHGRPSHCGIRGATGISDDFFRCLAPTSVSELLSEERHQ